MIGIHLPPSSGKSTFVEEVSKLNLKDKNGKPVQFIDIDRFAQREIDKAVIDMVKKEDSLKTMILFPAIKDKLKKVKKDANLFIITSNIDFVKYLKMEFYSFMPSFDAFKLIEEKITPEQVDKARRSRELFILNNKAVVTTFDSIQILVTHILAKFKLALVLDK
jgi:hypothetical protein